MDPRTQERVEEWDSRPFNGGFDGLSDLADADFSGAVSAVGTWLFMLNGRIIGIVDGDIEDFEAASGTCYEAPHPSLPLLCAMEERGGETRAKYYTNETPLREVDNTLQSGSFTGYVELSENVLSGDYYAVYYGGRRMAAAYIGNAERLLTGDEAFERAADEVGIYEVVDVEIEVTDVPGTGDADPDTGAEGASAADPNTGSDPTPGSGPTTGPGTDVESTGAESAIETSTPAGEDSDADATADPRESSIDPIDVSSSEAAGSEVVGSDAIDDAADDPSLSSDIDLTDDPAGITATDETGTESDREPTGITDTPPSIDTDPEPESETDAVVSSETAPTSDESVPRDAAIERTDRSGRPRDQRRSEAGIDAEPEPDPVTVDADESTADPTEAADAASATAATTDPDAASADATDPNTSESADGSTADAESETPSSPDLAEVEAAAEELDRNDISWVDESDEGPPIGDSTDGVATADDEAGDDETPPDGELEEQFEREEEWRETRRIPSIDPDNSESASRSKRRERGTDRSAASAEERERGTDRSSSDAPTATGSTGGGSDSRTEARTTESQTAEAPSSSTARDGSRDRNAGGATDETGGQPASSTGASSERVAALTEKLETLRERYTALETKAEELEAERDRLRSENDELSSTVERLQSRIETLETELEQAREDAGPEAEAGTQLSPRRALSETNLFVRYASKSQPTLETAHDGNADRSEVASNLRLERHTQFDSNDAVVDGRPYEEFLASSMEYRFVDWLTEMVLYEIRDTGNADGLADLYDAIPRIDRAELGATISLEDDDTDDVPDEVTFDIVAFDKMGNPLVLATLNDSREPATRGMLEELEEAASAVKANYPDLAAAIAVTSSYFEPGALEVAEQATSGGFLSRGSKLSYVNLSRKEGYHLCLVESRSEGFHMNIPEL